MIPRTTAGRALYDVLRDRGGLVPILNSIISIEDEAMTLHNHEGAGVLSGLVEERLYELAFNGDREEFGKALRVALGADR